LLVFGSAWPRALFLALAAGPHPRRELTPMLALRYPVFALAWPQALFFPALAVGPHPHAELTPMRTLGFTVLAFAWPQALSFYWLRAVPRRPRLSRRGGSC
jgi:hypothetical protein